MEALEAAKAILDDARTPLRVKEISARALRKGIWKTESPEPEKMMWGALAKEIRLHGDESELYKPKPGLYGLRKHCSTASPAERVDTPLNMPVNKPPALDGTLSFVESALKVLRECSNKTPLHYKDITDTAMERGWLATTGKTPEFIMQSLIKRRIRQDRDRATRSALVLSEDGYVALSEWSKVDVDDKIDTHNKHMRRDLLDQLLGMAPAKFEQLVSQLLLNMGFDNVETTSPSGDKGVDIRGTFFIGKVLEFRLAVQAKRWNKGRNVQASIVRQMHGSIESNEIGMIITTSDFSSGARAAAQKSDRYPIALVNGEQLVGLLVEYGTSVNRNERIILELDENLLDSTKAKR